MIPIVSGHENKKKYMKINSLLTLCEIRVNLNASDPHSGMPWGNIFFWPWTARFNSLWERTPAAWLAFDPCSRSCVDQNRQHISGGETTVFHKIKKSALWVNFYFGFQQLNKNWWMLYVMFLIYLNLHFPWNYFRDGKILLGLLGT